jgi:hypothetical protein
VLERPRRRIADQIVVMILVELAVPQERCGRTGRSHGEAGADQRALGSFVGVVVLCH